jgi:hypothetical protein
MNMKKLFLAAILILLSLYTIAQTAHKRIAPPIVARVAYDGLLLTAPSNKMGYIVATDSAGNEVWNVRIYKVHYDVFLERDVQAVYISHIELRKDALLILNEDDRHYILDLKTRNVTSLTD